MLLPPAATPTAAPACGSSRALRDGGAACETWLRSPLAPTSCTPHHTLGIVSRPMSECCGAHQHSKLRD